MPDTWHLKGKAVLKYKQTQQNLGKEICVTHVGFKEVLS